MDRLTYQEISRDLDEIDQWLRGRGLKQFDRIRTHKRNLDSLAQAADQGTIDGVAAGWSVEKRREIMWSLVESVEFTEAIKALKKMGCHVPASVLESALEGPPDLHFEDERSSRGRNTMFEIAIAGRVARGGFTPQLGKPDVFFELDDRRIFIECKRVFSEKSVSKRVLEASDQLTRELNCSCDPRDCGLVALSISRLFNQGDKVFVAPDVYTLRQMLKTEVDAVRNKLERTYRGVKHPRTAGVLFHLSTPALVEDIGLYMAAHSVTIHHITGKSDAGLLRKLAERIE